MAWREQEHWEAYDLKVPSSDLFLFLICVNDIPEWV